MIPRIDVRPVSEGSLAPVVERARLRSGGVASSLLDAVVAHDAAKTNREALAGGALAVTTGQQPGLFGGPLYTIYKGLGAAAVAKRLRTELGVPVVPVFWVAGDDHDFQEASYAGVLGVDNTYHELRLRDRPAEATQLPMYRERVGPEIEAVFEDLRRLLPDTEFRRPVLKALEAQYGAEANVADAFAQWAVDVLGRWGVLVFRPYAASAKRASAPLIIEALRSGAHRIVDPGPIEAPGDATLVMVEGAAGRDRLIEDDGTFHARRSGERWTLEELEALAETEPERLSANVLLRPVVEAALLPTVAYVAGPGELAYLPQAAPLYPRLGVTPQVPLPRFGARLVESKIEKVLEKFGIAAEELAAPAGQLEGRLMRDELPDDVRAALSRLRGDVGAGYGVLQEAVTQVDPTLRKPVASAKGAALGSISDIEKRLVSHLKQNNETALRQIEKARANLFPKGRPQERMLSWPMYAVRYGDPLLEALWAHAQSWADDLPLEGPSAGP